MCESGNARLALQWRTAPASGEVTSAGPEVHGRSRPLLPSADWGPPGPWFYQFITASPPLQKEAGIGTGTEAACLLHWGKRLISSAHTTSAQSGHGALCTHVQRGCEVHFLCSWRHIALPCCIRVIRSSGRTCNFFLLLLCYLFYAFFNFIYYFFIFIGIKPINKQRCDRVLVFCFFFLANALKHI